MQYTSINFGDYYGSRAYTDLYAYNGNDLVFASVTGSDGQLKAFQRAIRNGQGCSVQWNRLQTPRGKYEVEKYKDHQSKLSHMIVFKKPLTKPVENDNEMSSTYLMVEHEENEFEPYRYIRYSQNEDMSIPEDIKDRIYDTLADYTGLPVVEDWKDFLADFAVRNRDISTVRVEKIGHTKETQKNFRIYHFSFRPADYASAISTGLREQRIAVNESNTASAESLEISGMDSYLNVYSIQLAEKIQENFKPKFDPSRERYDKKLDWFEKHAQSNGLNPYPAQKAVMQAVSNNMKQNDVSIIVGEMSAGKTIQSMGAIYTHTNKTKTNNIIMAPSTILKKWKRELKSYMPNSTSMIVSNFEDFLEAVKIMENPLIDKHFFVIMSPETAKLSYMKRPAVFYKQRKIMPPKYEGGRVTSARNVYLCPDCHMPVFKMETNKNFSSRKAVKKKEYLTHIDFVEENKHNQFCINEIKDHKNLDSNGKPKFKTCGAPLWTINLKDEEGTEWVKLKKYWVNTNAYQDFYNHLDENKTTNKEETIQAQIALYKNDPNQFRDTGPKKYSIGQYVLTFMKGKIDYFISDEIHNYASGDSQCGRTFGHLIMASKKTIGLTGTLLNGYANSIFYLLYRCYSRKMSSEDFKFKGERAFAGEYGVIETTTSIDTQTYQRKNRNDFKIKPGISPIVFTRFLLGNAAFISLDEMKDGMAPYREIPVGIPMGEHLLENYEELERNARSSIGGKRSGSKTLSQIMHLLYTYPDMPYGRAPVIHPDSKEIVLTPVNLDEYRTIRTPKMEHLLALVREKKENNEKVLVYYTYTNETDIASRLIEMFEEEGISAAELKSGTGGSAANRESWIKNKIAKDELDVLICNPQLVEVGLDLIEFTASVFYQIPYNIHTLRQASRRTWRLTQTRPVEVYFYYYEDSTQQQALSLMANKLEASMAIEGKFSEEGLQALSNNDDILMRIANSVANGIREEVQAKSFEKFSHSGSEEGVDKKEEKKYFMPYETDGLYRNNSRKYLTETQRAVMTHKKRRESVAQLMLEAV